MFAYYMRELQNVVLLRPAEEARQALPVVLPAPLTEPASAPGEQR